MTYNGYIIGIRGGLLELFFEVMVINWMCSSFASESNDDNFEITIDEKEKTVIVAYTNENGTFFPKTCKGYNLADLYGVYNNLRNLLNNILNQEPTEIDYNRMSDLTMESDFDKYWNYEDFMKEDNDYTFCYNDLVRGPEMSDVAITFYEQGNFNELEYNDFIKDENDFMHAIIPNVAALNSIIQGIEYETTESEIIW